jgi:tripartite-type tricarboxylate transporter receptor subunit TctC
MHDTIRNTHRGAALMQTFALVTCIAFLGGIPMCGAAETFPSQPIEVVIHARYGGATDTTARLMMIRARRILNTDMRVVAKRGGAGAKAHHYALGKPHDGYTVLAFAPSHLYTIARGMSPLKIDDVVGVARAMEEPTFITVDGKSPYTTLEELVTAAKTKPLKWGVSLAGGTEHIGLVRFAKAAGITFTVVPYGSSAQMVHALIAGAIDATLPNVSEVRSQLQDGILRSLAVMSQKRLEDYPDVPTTYEKGYPIEVSTTRGYFVLKGTPQDRIEILSKAMVKAMRHKTFANYLRGVGLTVKDSVAGHEVWDKQIKQEYARGVEVLKDMGLIKTK